MVFVCIAWCRALGNARSLWSTLFIPSMICLLQSTCDIGFLSASLWVIVLVFYCIRVLKVFSWFSGVYLEYVGMRESLRSMKILGLWGSSNAIIMFVFSQCLFIIKGTVWLRYQCGVLRVISVLVVEDLSWNSLVYLVRFFFQVFFRTCNHVHFVGM